MTETIAKKMGERERNNDIKRTERQQERIGENEKITMNKREREKKKRENVCACLCA